VLFGLTCTFGCSRPGRADGTSSLGIWSTCMDYSFTRLTNATCSCSAPGVTTRVMGLGRAFDCSPNRLCTLAHFRHS